MVQILQNYTRSQIHDGLSSIFFFNNAGYMTLSPKKIKNLDTRLFFHTYKIMFENTDLACLVEMFEYYYSK